MQFLKIISHTQSEERVVDAANYGHSRNHLVHQIVSPVPGLSYQDILRILCELRDYIVP
ncbi:hypothetical protein NC652_024684 [Populus alba x Populus x berolinensis]|nr:hypothetical protein NC652_024681 [Populus alba x Populus x berolinensis]KAJ6897933.1 hypothetical protein NC652_024684 [Populus alba x Populus x berolinensis]